MNAVNFMLTSDVNPKAMYVGVSNDLARNLRRKQGVPKVLTETKSLHIGQTIRQKDRLVMEGSYESYQTWTSAWCSPILTATQRRDKVSESVKLDEGTL